MKKNRANKMKDIYENLHLIMMSLVLLKTIWEMKNFFDRIFRKHNVRTFWIVPVVGQHLYMLSQLGIPGLGIRSLFLHVRCGKKNLQQKVKPYHYINAIFVI